MIWVAVVFVALLLGGTRGGTDSVARQHGEQPAAAPPPAPPAAGVLTCRDPPPPAGFNDSSTLGSWYLLQCFMDQENTCTARNCLRFELITPEERKNLSAAYSERVARVAWEQVVLRLVTPCADVKDLASPNYLERTAPGQYQLITLPIGPKDVRPLKPRPLRLQLLQGRFLVMLDCAELEPVVLVHEAPPPGYKTDPALASLLAFDEF